MTPTGQAIEERWSLIRELGAIPTRDMGEDEREACMVALIADQKARGIA